MSSFVEDVLDAMSVQPPTRCVTCRFLESLPDDERPKAEGLFLDRDVSSKLLAEKITAHGFPVCRASVNRHRAGHPR